MHQRKPDDLSALDTQGVPMELAPFVASVNGLLLRLKDSIATQKRFLADAAHQLKTPLAGLRMQADLAQREGASAEDLKQSLRQIGRSSVRATHTVNQLLALARAEAGSMVLSRRACDLAQLTLEVVKDAVQRSLDQHLDIGYEGLSALAPQDLIRGNATLLKEMVRNLLDNAMLYTPSSPELPGIVTVRVVHDPHTAELLLQVENSGPGIAPAQRELVFQPFYRVLGNTVDGSGLGLSIVAEIAQQHHAVIAITDGSPGHATPGVCFTVRFLR
jgi:two-component system sensor histidine kinase TctE